jgi:predicted RNA binding protein YcfA (HicA-like mRNA interferase family)
MKAKELARLLARKGATLLRKKGHHHVCELPNGAPFVLLIGGVHNDVKPYLLRKLEAAQKGITS